MQFGSGCTLLLLACLHSSLVCRIFVSFIVVIIPREIANYIVRTKWSRIVVDAVLPRRVAVIWMDDDDGKGFSGAVQAR